MARYSLILATLSTAFLTDLASCWDLSISSTLFQDKFGWCNFVLGSCITISCRAPGGTNCQFRFYNHERQANENTFDCSKDPHWEAKKKVWCVDYDTCKIRFYTADVTTRRYVVGCRARDSNEGGGWKYGYTTMYVHDNQVYLPPVEKYVVVELGKTIAVSCTHSLWPKREINQCILSMPNNLKNYDVDLSGGTSYANSRFSYFGRSLYEGDCGIQLSNASEQDHGIVWCRVTYMNNANNVRAFALIVAKPPSDATLTLHRDPGSNTLLATCSVSPARPGASIKWLLNGSTMNQDGIQVSEKATENWIWPWDEQRIEQTLTIPRGNEKDSITCEIRHNNNTIFIKTENLRTEPSYTPPGVTPLNNSRHQNATDGYKPSSAGTLAPETPDLQPGGTMHSVSSPPTVSVSNGKEHAQKDARLDIGFVIGMLVASLICLLIVAIVAYSTWKRRWCFSEHSTAVLIPSKDGAANQNTATREEPTVMYSEVNKESRMSKKYNPGAANEEGAAIQNTATIENPTVIYSVVNKEPRMGKNVNPGAVSQKGVANQNRSTIKEPVIYSVVNKEPKMSKKVNPGSANEEGAANQNRATIEDQTVIYSEVNKEPRMGKEVNPGATNEEGVMKKRGSTKDDASVFYSVVNNETKIKKKATPGTSAAADSGVIYAEIVNTNAGNTAGKPKAALPQENVEYTALKWN